MHTFASGMEPYLRDETLLTSDRARKLYREHAGGCPIFDFHTHLSPQVFVENRTFRDLTQLWIDSDPYKWRSMRINGIPESIVTGAVSPRERFESWAQTLPQLVGSPLYDWSRMELGRYFDLWEPLSVANSEKYWNHCNHLLKTESFRPRNLLLASGVEAFVTSDAWLDPLDWHLEAQKSKMSPKMLPSLRMDDLFRFTEANYKKWLEDFEGTTGIKINSLADMLMALARRMDDFSRAGCVLSDFAIDIVNCSPCSFERASAIFNTLLQTSALDPGGKNDLETFLIVWLGGECALRKWTMQLHIGARRDASRSLKKRATKPGGNALMRTSVNDDAIIELLNIMESEQGLPRTIIYSANTVDFDWIGCLSGIFVEDSLPAKVQLGPSWWYNDNIEGINRFIRTVSNHGILMHSPGMNTDSRSFLSSVRQDYFRRVLCRILGEWIEENRLIDDSDYYGNLIKAVCYRNAKLLLNHDQI